MKDLMEALDAYGKMLQDRLYSLICYLHPVGPEEEGHAVTSNPTKERLELECTCGWRELVKWKNFYCKPWWPEVER